MTANMIEDGFLGLSPQGFHRVAYTQWGDPAAERTVVCVHGLTRNSRDFDALATALAEAGLRVVCPDMVGRGRSDRLADPMDYGAPQYVRDMTALIARLGVDRVDWVGTSMGGVVGMQLAAERNSPVGRLVLNDIGPFIPKAPLDLIAAYVGWSPVLASVEEVEAHMRRIYAGFGTLTDAQWRHLAMHEARPRADGGYSLGYDPAIAEPIRRNPPTDVDMWSDWDRIEGPVLVVRGAASEVLPAGVVEQMRGRGPGIRVHEVADAGHAPALMAQDQIAAIRDFLMETP